MDSPAPASRCASCGEPLSADDQFCPSCGARVASDPKPESDAAARKRAYLQGIKRSRQVRARRARTSAQARASFWILIVAVVILVWGTIVSIMAASDVGDYRQVLDKFPDDFEVQIRDTDETITVSELKSRYDRSVVLSFVVTYVVGAIMLGLFFWSRRSPFPAMVTALCVFLALTVLIIVASPALFGILFIAIWVLTIGALLGGMKAALAERSASLRAPGAPRSSAVAQP
jgi:zinc ribbon protein